MSPTITTLDEIDLEVSVAFVALGVARSAFTRCPSTDNQRAVDIAENAVNQLLDARLAAQR